MLKPLPLRVLKLPSMEYRRKRGDMIQCFKIMNGLVRIETKELFTPIPSAITRGHNRRVLRQKSNKAARAMSFSQRTIGDWNSLPKTVVEAPSVNAFKNRLDEAWKDNVYRSSVV